MNFAALQVVLIFGSRERIHAKDPYWCCTRCSLPEVDTDQVTEPTTSQHFSKQVGNISDNYRTFYPQNNQARLDRTQTQKSQFDNIYERAMFTFKLFEFSRQKATYGKCDKNVTNVTKCDKCDILAIFGAKIQMYEDEKYYF